jgi:hypothetical protein
MKSPDKEVCVCVISSVIADNHSDGRHEHKITEPCHIYNFNYKSV